MIGIATINSGRLTMTQMSGQQALAGRTAWVSGGAGGIGAACAKFLLRDGAAMPFGSLSSYCTSKAGLEMFVRCAAEELGARKIRVNAVRPGMTRNSSNDAMFANDKLIGKFLAEIPLGRTGEPEDIAGAVR